MTWRYNSTTGELLFPSGDHAATGYSGHGEGVNNPADEAIPNVGPIPHGTWRIGEAFTHPACGPIAMRLEAEPGTDAHGRSGFLIHGDTASADHTASHGCLILPRDVRRTIAASQDRLLLVVAGEAAPTEGPSA